MNHNLIERLQNFTLDRKLLSIDSNDRDISKWADPSEFEITCPQVYSNVESLRLINIQIPNKFYNISEELQNNKLRVNFNNTDLSTITLDDGLYTPIQLQTALQYELSRVNSDFVVKYNEVNSKMYFGNTDSDFSFNFDETISYNYNINGPCNTNIYDQHSNWGLGAILGFDKKIYTSSSHPDADKFSWEPNQPTWIANTTHIIVSPKPIDLDENQFIYIEIDKLNNCDEIQPFKINKHTNTNNGIMNSFFAKVPINKSEHNQSFSAKDIFLENISYFQPPIEKISKLKLKFRHHNGSLVNFHNYNVSLMIEINQIRNEIKNYNVRKPYTI